MSQSIDDRFPTAVTSDPPTPAQRAAVAELQLATVTLARRIQVLVPEGRDKSIALTSLEDVLMRANRGVFTTASAPGAQNVVTVVNVSSAGVIPCRCRRAHPAGSRC